MNTGTMAAAIIAVVSTGWTGVSPAAADLVLQGATVYDGRGGAPLAAATVRIRGERIQCVGRAPDCAAEAGDEVIELSGQFITPGLVDSHVHFSQTGWLDGRPHHDFVAGFYDYEALQAGLKESQDRWHRAYLCSGITAVFDPGGLPWTPGYEEAARGRDDRVHYRGAGPLITHAQVTALRALGGDTFLPMDSDEAVADGVAKLKSWGARAIKVWYLDPPAGRREELDQRLLKVGELARRQGLPLVVHATELHTAKQALRAGARMLVHSVEDEPVDAEFIDLARGAEVIYAPTLQVGGNWQRALASATLGRVVTPDDPNRCIDAETLRVIADAPALRPRAPVALQDPNGSFQRLEAAGAERERMLANLKAVYEAGITVVAATDAGNPLTFHGPAIYRELELMQSAGIPPAELIPMATANGARVLDMSADIGTLEAGRLADLIVLSEDPAESASAFRSIHHVMHLGRYRPVAELARE